MHGEHEAFGAFTHPVWLVFNVSNSINCERENVQNVAGHYTEHFWVRSSSALSSTDDDDD